MRIIESNAVADVRIFKPDTAAATQVTIMSGNKSKIVIAPFAQNRGHARCEVEIHDLTGEMENTGGKAAWIIISKPVDILADSEISRDDIDIINML